MVSRAGLPGSNTRVYSQPTVISQHVIICVWQGPVWCSNLPVALTPLRPLTLKPQPDTHCVVPRSRRNTLAIGRPGDAVHIAGMAGVGEEAGATGSVPHLHCLVKAGRGEALAI